MFPSASTVIAAAAGGGQAKATALSPDFNIVTVVASIGDSVKLPPAGSPVMCVVINATPTSMSVYPTGLTDVINGQPAQVPVLQPGYSVDFYIAGQAGQWYVEPGVGYSGSLFTESSADNLVARAGGGQALATQLTTQTARIATVATAGDSIRLPQSAPGLEILLINHGANPMQVYGFGTETIDDVATGTGVSQMQSSMVIYSCTTAGQWYTNGIGTGYAGSFPTVSSANNLTATAAGTQGTSLLLNSVINRVTTVATAGDAVKLPQAVAGIQIVVTNAAAANSMNVFPNTGDSINGAAANAAYAVPAGKTVSLSSAGPTFWHAVLSA